MEYIKLKQKTKNKISCPTCARALNPRIIYISASFIKPLAQVYKWCEANNKWTVERKDIEHIIGKGSNTTVSSNFHNLRFTGLIRQPKKRYYEISRGRVEAFLRNEYAIPIKVLAYWEVTKDDNGKIINATVKYEPMQESETTMRNIPKITKYLDSEFEYIVQYL